MPLSLSHPSINNGASIVAHGPTNVRGKTIPAHRPRPYSVLNDKTRRLIRNEGVHIRSDVHDAVERSQRVLDSLLTDRNVREVAKRAQRVLREKHLLTRPPPPVATMRKFITKHYRSVFARTPGLPPHIQNPLSSKRTDFGSNVGIHDHMGTFAEKAADTMAQHYHTKRKYEEDLKGENRLSPHPMFVGKKMSTKRPL